MMEETEPVFRCILLNTMSTKVVTLRLDTALEKKLGKLARSTNRSRSFLAAEAIREYVATNEWQIEEIGKALNEADRGDFAGDREVQRVMKKWTKKAR
jgi:RHH-type rel operon transcriptional repressor/antitoxin RelB